MGRMRTRHVFFSVSHDDNPLPNDTVLVCEATDPLSMEARKGELFVVVESRQDSQRQKQPIQLVMRTLRKLYYENSSFSVQSALRRAIIAANRALYEYNMTQEASRRVQLGMTCVVVKGVDLYIAQIAPSQLYVLSEGIVRAIPSSALWRTVHHAVVPVNAGSLMGGSLTVEPEFFRAVWTPGETLILTTSSLNPVLDRETVSHILRLVHPTKMVQALREACQSLQVGNAHGLCMVLDADVAEETKPATGSFSSITQQLMLARGNTGLWLNNLVKWVRGLLLGSEDSRFATSMKRWRNITREETHRATRPPPEVPYKVNPIPRPAPIDVGESIEQQVQKQAEARMVRTAEPAPTSPRVIDAVDVEVPSTPVDTDYKRRYGGVHVRVTEPIRYGDFLGSVLQGLFVWRWFPKRNSDNRRMQSAAQGAGLSYRKQRPPFPWAMLSLMAAIVLVLFFYGRNVATEYRLQRGEDSITVAEQSVQAIYDSVNESEAAQRIEIAQSLLSNLQQTGIVTTTVDYRQRFLVMVDRIAQAERIIQRRSYLTNVTPVATHPQANGVFSAIVIPPIPTGNEDLSGFNNIYFLDSNVGVLYQMPQAGGTLTPMLQPSDVMGDIQIAKVYDIAWRIDGVIAVAQSSNNGAFVYLFRNGENWNYSILAGSLEWQLDDRDMRINSYGGNLYIWGVTPNNILRFLATQIADFPAPWVQNDGGVDATAAVDMGIDGRIYLLMPNGTINLYQAIPDGERGFEKSIQLQNVVPPIQATSRLLVTGDGDSGAFYILDSYFSRIIHVDKRTGKFIQQIVLPPDSTISFDNLTALAIDESGARPILYLANGNVVYKAPLPEPPLPFNQRVDSVVLPTATVVTQP